MIDRDWIIELVPREERGDRPYEPGCLYVLRGDAEDAIDMLELYAAAIQASGRVPDGLDWRNGSLAAVIRRWGKLTYMVRVDSFEYETDNGMTQGFGWLRAREVSDG